ncbi:hypothetical protein L4D06_01580 [Enterovibrio makurazakiensis]|uniref:lipopolysaccharide biosynthesis protein n=1 Tax=Enterovibrio makurazakiensis TaxID=2910232 RepID=UPI003D19A07D
MYLKGIIQILSGNIIAQGIMFTSTFILGLYYSQEAVGTYAIFSSYIVIISIFTSLRLEQGISKAKRRNEVLKLLDIIITSSLCLTVIYFSILPFTVDKLKIEIGVSLTVIYLGSISLTIFNVSNSILTYGCKFDLISKSKIIKATAFVSLLYLLKDFHSGIILSFICSHVIIYLYVKIKYDIKYKPRKNRILNSLKRHKEFEYIYRYSVPNACLNVISQQIPIIAGALLYPASVIGAYFLFDKIIRTPAIIIMQSLRPVLIRYYSNTKKLKSGTYYWHVLFLVMFASVYSIVAFYLTQMAMTLEAAKEWVDGSEYLIPILIISFSQISNTATIPYLLSLKKTKNLFYLEILNLSSRIGVAAICLNGQSAPGNFFILISLISLIIFMLNILVVKLTSIEVDDVKR